MPVFRFEEINKSLSPLYGWYFDENVIRNDGSIRDFHGAVSFINNMAKLAEDHDHSAELFNINNYCSVSIGTRSMT